MVAMMGRMGMVEGRERERGSLSFANGCTVYCVLCIRFWVGQVTLWLEGQKVWNLRTELKECQAKLGIWDRQQQCQQYSMAFILDGSNDWNYEKIKNIFNLIITAKTWLKIGRLLIKVKLFGGAVLGPSTVLGSYSGVRLYQTGRGASGLQAATIKAIFPSG